MRRPASPGPASLRARVLGTAALTLLAAVAALDVATGRVVERVVADGFHLRLEAALDALAAGLERDEETGRPVLRADPPGPAFGTPFSGWYWQVTETGVVVFASSSLWQGRLDPEGPGPEGEALERRGRRVAPPGGGAPLEVTVAAPRRALEGEKAAAQAPMRLALAGFAAVMLVLSLAQTALLLSPLRRLRRGLAALRVDGAARLPPAPFREIAPLVEEVNALRAADAERVARAERQAADLAHGIKTPLAAIRNAAGADATVARAARRIERQLRQHLARARVALGTGRAARCPVRPVAEDLMLMQRALHGRRGVRVELRLVGDPAFAGARADLEEMLGNLLDNACSWSETAVALEARAEGGRLRLAVEDDGPGLAPAEAARMVLRGARLDTSRDGHGLGLAITAGLAELHGGRLSLGCAAMGGLRAVLDLPAGA